MNVYGYAGGNPFKDIDPLGLYTAVQVTLPDGTPYIPMTQVKNPAQASAFGEPEGTCVAIPVPPGMDPQAEVGRWLNEGQYYDPFSLNLNFGQYWGDPAQNYKSVPGLGPMFDAYANFEYGATGAAAGFSLPYLQVAAPIGKWQLPFTNNPINVNDIGSGYSAVQHGGTIGTTEWTPP
jgi:hypothetical protein